MTRRIKLLICENFVEELRAALQDLNQEGVEILCFPSDCAQSLDALRLVDRFINAQRLSADSVHLLGACCLSDSQRSCFPDNWHLHYFDQCFYMFVNRPIVDALIEQRAYLLTPGWLANWQTCLQEMGFDRRTARQFFAETTQKLTLLDTGIDPNSPARLQEMASYLDLPCDILPVGLDYFRLYVKSLLEKDASASVDLHQADYAMALDLAAQMTGLIHEDEIIEKTFDVFSMLFAPQRLAFYPLLDFSLGGVRSRPPQMSVSPAQIEERIRWAAEKREFAELEDGFLFRLRQRDETLGVLEVDQIALPRYRRRYLTAALNVARICGAAVANARSLQKMIAMQKMADLGTLIAGIAHEINSPLQVVTGVSDTLFERFIKSRDELFLKQRLELLSHNAWRIAEIIRSLLSYVSPGQLAFGLHDLNGIVSDVLLIAANQIKGWANIQAQTEFAPHLPPLPCDRQKISQALLHLLSNACDAMPDGGSVLIRTGYHAKRRRLLLSVSDKGKGIPKERQARVFAPFFTTKEMGGGAGLGLSVVQGIVNAHGGEVELVSAEGQGAAFTLYLPDTPQPPGAAPAEGAGRFDDPPQT